VQQGERRHGVDDVLAVLLHVGVADRQVLAPGADLGGDRQRAGLARPQVGDGQL
jgi:hypothetical protein